MEDANGNKMAENGLSLERKEKIQQLRERVLSYLSPEQEDYNFLIKWLIVRNFDVDKAEVMLRKHIRFYKVNGLCNLDESNYTPSEVFDYIPTAKLGYDREGCTVRLLNVGIMDVKGICTSVSKEECVKYAVFVLEKDYSEQESQMEQIMKSDKQVYIMDLENMSWTIFAEKIVYERAYSLMRLYEGNHPDRLKVVYVINAPAFFQNIYNWLKLVLPEMLISKMKVLAKDEVQSKFQEHIDLSIIPASIGGSRIDANGDPTCPSLYRTPLGSRVPENLKPTKEIEALKYDPEAKTVTVDYNSVYTHDIVVTEPDSCLCWNFLTLDYDIRMSIRYKKDEISNSEDIIPCHRVESHIIPESGSFICENKGIYQMIFDNTYSWITSKQLTFKIGIYNP